MNQKFIIIIILLSLLGCDKCDQKNHDIIQIDIIYKNYHSSVRGHPIYWDNIDGFLERLYEFYNDIYEYPDVVKITDKNAINKFFCKFNKLSFDKKLDVEIDLNIICILLNKNLEINQIIALNDVNLIQTGKNKVFEVDNDFGEYIIDLLPRDPRDQIELKDFLN
jgi:hypothetical protein